MDYRPTSTRLTILLLLLDILLVNVYSRKIQFPCSGCSSSFYRMRGGGNQLFVKTLTVKTVAIEVEKGETIKDIKNKVFKKEGIPLKDQRLIFGGQQLQDGKTLEDYDVGDGTLHLVVNQNDKSSKEENLVKFVNSLQDIEKNRLEQISELQKEMKVDHLPNKFLENEQMLNLLHPKVKAVVEAFPLQAEEIVTKNGLDIKDFNEMLKKTKKNPLFRLKVKKILNN